MHDTRLTGRHVLIIEDNFYQAEESRESLAAAGAVVAGCRATPPDLDDLLAHTPVDIALLDINLGQFHSFDLARALLARDIPFVFLTGYDPSILPPDLAAATVIAKPADTASLIDALALRLGAGGPEAEAEPG
jgi:CheY-like chemotaxis protein